MDSDYRRLEQTDRIKLYFLLLLLFFFPSEECRPFCSQEEGREIIFWGLNSWIASSKGKMEQKAIGGGHAFVFSRRQSGRSTIAIHRHLTSHRNRFTTVCKDTYRACCQAVLGIDPIQRHWPHHCWCSQHSDCMLIRAADGGKGEAETCFVIKCTEHLSCCCLLMFQHFKDAMNYVGLAWQHG